VGYYQAGDYYQRGEIAALARRVAGPIARLGGKLLAGGATAATIYEAYKGVTGAPAAAGAASAPGGGAAAGGGRTYRRINPLNPRALRRSLRRIQGFARFARKVMHFAHPARGSRSRFKFPKRRKR